MLPIFRKTAFSVIDAFPGGIGDVLTSEMRMMKPEEWTGFVIIVNSDKTVIVNVCPYTFRN